MKTPVFPTFMVMPNDFVCCASELSCSRYTSRRYKCYSYLLPSIFIQIYTLAEFSKSEYSNTATIVYLHDKLYNPGINSISNLLLPYTSCRLFETGIDSEITHV